MSWIYQYKATYHLNKVLDKGTPEDIAGVWPYTSNITNHSSKTFMALLEK